MKRAASVRALLAGWAVVAAAGCAETDDIDTIQDEISGGWYPITLAQGWSNYNTSNPPAIGKVNDVLTLRGAIKGNAMAGTHVFTLPEQYRTYHPELLALRTVTAGSTGGTLLVDYYGVVKIHEDFVTPGTLGANAKIFTSLDGVSFDYYSGDATMLADDGGTPNGAWFGIYGHRFQYDEQPASVKLVGGFVRFQGWLKKTNTGDPNETHLFQLPSTPVNFRPGQTVYVPVALCGGEAQQRYGRLIIEGGTGNVYVQPENWDMAAANCNVSLEGASFALSSATQTLNLQNGWVTYSPRPVRVRLSGGVVRFQGAVYNGNYPQIAIGLPTSMRPPVNVYIQADSYGATRARIQVSPQGWVSVDAPILPISQDFTSLDGVSFGL